MIRIVDRKLILMTDYRSKINPHHGSFLSSKNDPPITYLRIISNSERMKKYGWTKLIAGCRRRPAMKNTFDRFLLLYAKLVALLKPKLLGEGLSFSVVRGRYANSAKLFQRFQQTYHGMIRGIGRNGFCVEGIYANDGRQKKQN